MKKFLFRVILLILTCSVFFFLGAVLQVDKALFGLVIALGAFFFFLLGYLLSLKKDED